MKNNKKETKEEKFLNQIENILKKIFLCKWLYYILALIIAFGIYYMNITHTIHIENIVDGKYVKYFLIGATIVILIIGSLFIFNNKSQKIPIHYKYLIIALILGFTYTFASPVFTQSDESFHFIRAYQVSKGHFLSPYDENGNAYDVFPESIFNTLWDDDDRYPENKTYEDSYRESQMALNKGETGVHDVRAHVYVFLNYLPQAFGIEVGKLLNQSPYMMGLLGRICNMLACIVIVAIGIYLIPYCKKSLSILLLAPSILAYFASLSADGLIIATSFLLIALVLKYRNEKKLLTWKQYLLLLTVIAFVATCKVAYLPLIGIIIFLPYECFKDKKTKWLYCCSLIFFGLLFGLSWMTMSHVKVSSVSEYTGIYKYLRFALVFVNTFFTQFIDYIQNIFAGGFMYQAQVKPLAIVAFGYLFIWILSFLSEKTPNEFRLIEKTIVGGIIFIIILLVSYAMYIDNTTSNAILVNGIQGRYFAPLCLLVPFFLSTKKLKCSTKELLNVSLILNAFVLLNMIFVFAV